MLQASKSFIVRNNHSIHLSSAMMLSECPVISESSSDVQRKCHCPRGYNCCHLAPEPSFPLLKEVGGGGSDKLRFSMQI